MRGALHLIPVGLGEAAPERWLPAEVRPGGQAGYHIAENAKTARAFLKLVGTERPLQEITIHTLSDKADDGQIQSWLQSARQGGEIGLVSEAGCPAVADPGAKVGRRPPPGHRGATLGRPLLHPAGTDGQRPGRAALRLPRLCAVDAGERAKQLRAWEQHSARHDQTQLLIETPTATPPCTPRCWPASRATPGCAWRGPHHQR